MNLPGSPSVGNTAGLVPGIPDVGTRKVLALNDPEMPFIQGGNALLQQFSGAAAGYLEELRKAEEASDDVQGRAFLSKMLADKYDRMQNLPSFESNKEALDGIQREMDEDFQRYMEGIGAKGFKNVRSDAARKRLQLAYEDAKAGFQVDATKYLLDKRRQDTFQRFEIGFQEAAEAAGPSAESDIAAIGQLMRESGVDAVRVKAEEERALKNTALNRFNRLLNGIALEDDPAFIEERFSALEAELNDPEGAFRHLSADERQGKLVGVVQEKSRFLKLEREARQKEQEEAEKKRIEERDNYFLGQMFDGTFTVDEALSHLDNPDSPYRMSSAEAASMLEKANKLRSDLEAQPSDRGLLVDLETEVRRVTRMQNNQVEREALRDRINDDFKKGLLTDSHRKTLLEPLEKEEGEEAQLRALQTQKVFTLNFEYDRLEGNHLKPGYANSLFDAYNVGDITAEQYRDAIGAIREDKKKMSTPEGERELNRQKLATGYLLDRLERMHNGRAKQGGKKALKGGQLRMGVYTGDRSSFAEESRTFPTGLDIRSKDWWPSYETRPLTDDEFLTLKFRIENYVLDNPNATQPEIEAFINQELLPRDVEAAMNADRFQTGTSLPNSVEKMRFNP